MNTRTGKLQMLLGAALLATTPLVRADYHVLTVGIDKYREPGKNLTGCVNDAVSFTAALQKHYGIPETAISQLADEQATKAAIVKAIEEKLITPAKAGDTLIFYYAGHGDFTPDLDGDEDDQVDEALIASDGDARNPGTWLTDDELARLFAGAKTSNVLMVFDSCHSGTIHRTASGLAETRCAGFGNRRSVANTTGTPVKPDRFTSGLSRSAPNHVILSACDAAEEANEIRGKDWDVLGKSGHKDGGLFTSALLEVLEKEPNAELKKLLGNVQKLTAEWVEKLGKRPQSPQFEMPKQEFRLASYIRGAETPVTVAAIVPPPAPSISLTSEGVITSGIIKLDLKTNGRVFHDGDLLKMELSPDQDAYVRLYYLSAENKVLQVFPNQIQKDNFIRKGTKMAIPGPTSGFDFRMGKPFGNEVLKVVASSTQFSDLEDETWAQQLFQGFSQTSLQSMSVRGIDPKATERKFGEAVLIYSVKDKAAAEPAAATAPAPAAAPTPAPAAATAAPAATPTTAAANTASTAPNGSTTPAPAPASAPAPTTAPAPAPGK